MNHYKYIIIILLTSLFFLNNTQSINLGRSNDPRTINDISKIKLIYKKTFWTLLSWLGPRNVASLAFPKSISHMNSDTMVSLTIDDGFCGLDNPNGDMTKEINGLLKKYNAKATFFITGSHINNTNKDEIINIIDNGHEIANHNMYDIPYNKFNANDFENDLLETNKILSEFTTNISNWYRAPHAAISDNMHIVLDKYNLTHVIGDVFANDTSIPDPDWISNFILKKVKPGSIIIIHMPEKGVREWNYKALEDILIGLSEMNLKVVTLTELKSNELSN